MGLAATQARLLTITARKADCEFQSMTLSHQKLALARDMENVSSEYQNALSQTKLVYDYYGTGDTSIDLDYGLLMTPSIYNDYYPKTVTDAENKVILNSSYAAAARAAGIPVEGLEGTPSSTVRNAFIEALAEASVITPARAAAIESVTYANTMGVGSTTNATTSYTQISYDTLLEMIEANTNKLTVSDYGLDLEISQSDIESGQQQFCKIAGNRVGVQTYDANGNKKDWCNPDDGGKSTDSTMTLSSLLSNDTQYVFAIEESRGAAKAINSTAYIQQAICGTDDNSKSFTQYLIDQFSTILGGVAENETAMQYAANAVYNLVYPNSKVQELDEYLETAQSDYFDNDRKHHDESSHGEDRDDWNEVLKENCAEVIHRWGKNDRDTVCNSAESKIGIVASVCDDAGNGGQYHYAAINLNNIAQVFVTAMVDYLEGNNSNYSYEKGEIGNSSLYNSDKDDYQFTIAVQTEVDSDDDNLYANFYDALFNQICLNGWTENDQIEDTDYLTDLFKNGLAYISSIAEDGYYYQGSYSTDRAVLEVSDESAIAVAEAKYNTEKTKIENKEDTIDLKMKNLDTEISSLTTEYDSAKQIISKSVEKSFKRYDA